MIIEKTAIDVNTFKRPLFQFGSARQGFDCIIKRLGTTDSVYLLPAYIGISPKEGSGIFDPIKQNNADYAFYKMDRNLNIDLADLERNLTSIDVSKRPILLIVHYFGYVDPNIEDVARLALEHNAFIIEDEAHALYTDYVDARCGKYGDVSLFSLHKMLPFSSGGMIRENKPTGLFDDLVADKCLYNWCDYDLREISKRRKENASVLFELLEKEPLVKCLRYDEHILNTPQTFPIIVPQEKRDGLYSSLNDQGFGLVSLYHTMIPEISEEYSDAKKISSTITNLPVHQDVNTPDLVIMVKALIEFLEG